MLVPDPDVGFTPGGVGGGRAGLVTVLDSQPGKNWVNKHSAHPTGKMLFKMEIVLSQLSLHRKRLEIYVKWFGT